MSVHLRVVFFVKSLGQSTRYTRPSSATNNSNTNTRSFVGNNDPMSIGGGHFNHHHSTVHTGQAQYVLCADSDAGKGHFRPVSMYNCCAAAGRPHHHQIAILYKLQISARV